VLPFNFNHLYYFYVVARQGSFSKAAEELRISQSSISVQIKQFETSFERRLFDRVRSGVELTESGHILFQYAEKVFTDVEEIYSRLEEMDHQIRGSITVGTVNSIGIYMLPEFLQAFHSDHPDVKVAVDFGPPRDLAHRVILGRVDFAVLPSNRRYDGLTGSVLTRNKLFLITPPDHPLASKARVVPSDLEKFPFLGYEEGMELRAILDTLFRRMSLRVEFAMESSNVATIKHMVLAGLGIALLPETAVGEEIRRGLLARLDVPSLYVEQEITVYHKTNRALTPARAEFRRQLKEHFSPKTPVRARQ
jgi:DNA-binding transcriptional LysR family regulator